MRKILTQLLIILVCMPYLACAMPDCGHETVVIQSDVQPCADHQGQQTSGVMLLQDCAGVDVPLIQHDSLFQKTDFKSDELTASGYGSELFKADAFLEVTVRSVWDAASPPPPPSIALTTQCFRL
jgi:hypothetical protein